MAKYKIVKQREVDGVWFRAYTDKGDLVVGSVSVSAEGCEENLRLILNETDKREVVKEVEL
jgi:hypothetical protein